MHIKLQRLLKLYHFLLDQKRITLAEKKNSYQSYEARLKAYDAQLKEERELTTINMSLHAAFEGFAVFVGEQKSLIHTEMARLEEEMALLEAQIASQYADVKSIELTIESRMEIEQEELTRKETMLLDEVAQQQQRQA